MRFFIMGGGCYGTFYARQLRRAREAGAAAIEEIAVVDRDRAPRALRELAGTDVRHYEATWRDFLARHLAAGDPAPDDILVTPPFTPHLAFEWLMDVLPARLPGLSWRTEAFRELPATPFRQERAPGTLVLSHADWICPVNCIEPERCPKTRGPRHWDLDRTARELAERLGGAGQPVHAVELFHCHHVVYGVGGYPLARLPQAAQAIERALLSGPSVRRALIGTVSHCHGVLHLLVAEAGTEIEATRALQATQTHPLYPDDRVR